MRIRPKKKEDIEAFLEAYSQCRYFGGEKANPYDHPKSSSGRREDMRKYFWRKEKYYLFNFYGRSGDHPICSFRDYIEDECFHCDNMYDANEGTFLKWYRKYAVR